VTGGKGLHVVVPFAPEHDWATAYAAAQRLCQSLVEEQPDRLTLGFGKAGRSHKLLLDYKRNHRAAVAVAAYSARANPHGTVSLPVAWGELEAQPRLAWDFRTAQERVKAPDPWTSFWTCRQRLRVARR